MSETKRYFVVIDMPAELYGPTRDDGFYAPVTGDDPEGKSSLAGYIEMSLDEPGARTVDLTVYTSIEDLLADRDEKLDMFA